MSTIVLSPTGTASFPDGGGHWWVYLQYALGLRDLGFRVLWLERCTEVSGVSRARHILGQFNFADDEVLLYQLADEVERQDSGASTAASVEVRWLDVSEAAAISAIGNAEAMLNFDYSAPEAVLSAARRTALIDIDPGLLQVWWSKGEVSPAHHDLWFTTGETVGTADALFPSCGVDWIQIRPCVHLPSWPVAEGPGNNRFTTVTSWWGDEWLTLGDGTVLENNKRAAFMSYVELPRLSGASLELAAYFGQTDNGSTETPTDGVAATEVGGDSDDVITLLDNGWRLQRSNQVAGDPDSYRRYIQSSSGEFSCVKPSCQLFSNAWISDRTLCYLASGRPAVSEHTGPSDVLDIGAGLLRFNSLDGATEALRAVQDNYDTHRRAARQLAEEHFSAADNLSRIIDITLGPGTSSKRP